MGKTTVSAQFLRQHYLDQVTGLDNIIALSVIPIVLCKLSCIAQEKW